MYSIMLYMVMLRCGRKMSTSGSETVFCAGGWGRGGRAKSHSERNWWFQEGKGKKEDEKIYIVEKDIVIPC